MTTTISIETYYQVLGVTKKATIDEIKSAYRRKAKELHPDRNKKPDANEQFVLLTEAYECLLNMTTGKTAVDQQPDLYAEWQRESREQTRKQAREYAEMQYENFKKTPYYKHTQAAVTVIEHLYFFSSVLIILAPLWGYIFYGGAGSLWGLLITFLTIQYWAGIFQKKTNINLSSFFQSLVLIFKTKTFIYLALTIVNLIFLFRFTLNTQLTFLIFALGLLGCYLLMFLVSKSRLSFINKIPKVGLFLCVTPGVFNLFFLLNFLFSSNPTSETYSFVHKQEWYGTSPHVRGLGKSYPSNTHLEKTAYIDLENGKYEEYQWFRMFFDFEAMEYKSEITYNFEDGLFGLRVLKHYEFTK